MTKDKVEKRLKEITPFQAQVIPTDDRPVLSGSASLLRTGSGSLVTTGSNTWLEVLSHINIKRDRVEGGWQITNGKLTTDGTNEKDHHSRIRLPALVKDNYDLSLDYTLSRCKDGLGFILPVGDSYGVVWIGGWTDGSGQGMSGIGDIDGKSIWDNAKAPRRRDLFVVGKKYPLLIRVRVQGDNGSIVVFLEGKPFLQWAGKSSTISISNPDREGVRTPLPQSKCIELECHEPASFQLIKVRAVSGRLESP